jgi:hypothetical protein
LKIDTIFIAGKKDFEAALRTLGPDHVPTFTFQEQVQQHVCCVCFHTIPL